MKYESTIPGEPAAGVVAGLMFGSSVFTGLSYLLFKLPYPAKLDYYFAHLKGWSALRVHQLEPHLAGVAAKGYADYLNQLPSHWPLLLTAKFDLAALAGVVAGIAIAYAVGKDQPAITHITGRRLLVGREGIRRIKQISNSQCNRNGWGLKLHKAFSWHLSLQREASHFWVFGAVGSGKTQIISSLLMQAIARGDKAIVFDNKGDFTRWLPSIVLIAPWDKRSFAWDIARDCVNPQHAKELAAHLVKEGKEAIWHESARQILTAMVLELQRTQPKSWTWHSLFEMACAPQEQVNGWILKNVPEARRIAESSGKTVDSIMLNFSSSMGLVSNLALAWGDAPVERRFSFREWLQDGNDTRKTVVLQGNEDYAELAKSYLQAIISLVSKQINSPSFVESAERKIWFFLDEFPQLHELKDIAPLLEIGRSKGVRVVLGAQDFSQVRDIYGHDVASSWMSMVGTVIVAKVMSGETATFICEEMLGEQTIERTTFYEGKRQQPQRERQLVMEPCQLEDDLGPNDSGIRALVMGYGDAIVLDWPYTKLPKKRQPSIAAQWLDSVQELPVGAASEVDSPEPESVTSPIPSSIPRLRLRPLSPVELTEMASSGTRTDDAADDVDDLTDSAAGGNHEAR